MDRLLLPFLLSSDKSEADDLLADLLGTHVIPAAEGIARSTFGWPAARKMSYGARQNEDVEDIVAQVSFKILERLHDLKEMPEEDAIDDFMGYVAVTAYHTCSDYARARYPSWYRFRNKLRYTLTHHPDFALWEGTDGKQICGFSPWKLELLPVNRGWVNQARMDTEWYINRGSDDEVTELLQSAFTSAKAPIRLEDLMSLAGKILRLTDGPHVADVQLEYLKPSYLPSYFIDPVDAEGQRLNLRLLWKEIVQLPERQRLTLLLAVRDSGNTSIVVLFTEIGIASIREVSEAVGVSANEFARILHDLPLDDKTISRRLGVSRQQVSSCRLSARRRLRRRKSHVLRFSGNQTRH